MATIKGVQNVNETNRLDIFVWSKVGDWSTYYLNNVFDKIFKSNLIKYVLISHVLVVDKNMNCYK